MKVLLFSTQWPEYMIELANALADYAYTILMLPTNHRFTPEHKKLISPKVTFEPFEVIFYRSIRKNARMLFHILRILWKYKPDILHIQSNGHRLFYWIFFLKPRKTKLINTIHDPVKHLGDELSKTIDDSTVIFWSRIFTDKFIVHGKFLRDQLSAAYRINTGRISIIPHGHLGIYKKFQKYYVKEDPNTILFFGRIWKYKGLNILIEAANVLIERNHDLKFIIAGKGEDITQYRQNIKFKENIIFHNQRIPNEKVGALFEYASIIVLPYLEATFSGVIPIAFAYAKPVIATKVGSIPEVIIHKHTGILVEPNSSESLIKGISYLLERPVLRKNLGSNAYKYAINNLSWENIGIKNYRIYQSFKNK